MIEQIPSREGAVIRSLTVEDAKELTRLLVANREPHQPFQPLRCEGFFTVEAQRDRLAASEHLYAILDGDALAGMIELSNLARGPFQSASIWLLGRPHTSRPRTRHARGRGNRALGFGELALHRLEAATLVDNIASQRVLERDRFHRIGLAPCY
jgi:[ribosomal protein S5]-alanine N-acetyltransferase